MIWGGAGRGGSGTVISVAHNLPNEAHQIHVNLKLFRRLYTYYVIIRMWVEVNVNASSNFPGYMYIAVIAVYSCITTLENVNGYHLKNLHVCI
jgi:hypothetical protein